MSIALRVHEAEPIKKLLEVVASSGLAKASTESDEVEKLTAADKLKHDKLDLLLAFLGIVLLALVDFDEAHDIAVLKLGQSGHFGINELLEGLIRVDDLDGVAGASCVLCELHLAGNAASKRSS